MTGADYVAIIGGVTALVTALTTGIVTIIVTIKQNRMLASAAEVRANQSRRLEEVHVAVTGVPSKPKEGDDAKG